MASKKDKSVLDAIIKKYTVGGSNASAAANVQSAKKSSLNNAVKNKSQQPQKKKMNVVQQTKSSGVMRNVATEVVIDYTDVDNQKILAQSGKDVRINPASLTKMMTVYILLEKIKGGHIKLNHKIKVSRNAENQPASKTQAKAGDTITVESAIRAIVAWSANDIAVAVAEHIAGSVRKFALMMNDKARELGMTNTKFTNPSGLYGANHYSTAGDIAKLMIALSRGFSNYKYLLSADSYTYKNKTFRTRCEIVKMFDGVNCAKTGFIYESWFNLATTATRYNSSGGKRDLCVVIIGRKSSSQRYADAIKHMKSAFVGYELQHRPDDKVVATNKAVAMKPDNKVNAVTQNKAATSDVKKVGSGRDSSSSRDVRSSAKDDKANARPKTIADIITESADKNQSSSDGDIVFAEDVVYEVCGDDVCDRGEFCDYDFTDANENMVVMQVA